MLQRFKLLIRRFTQEHVAAPTEYIIALVIVMATVVTLAAYIGAWVAGKWAVLLVELMRF